MPRPSARRTALWEVRQCMQYASLFWAVHDSSESDEELYVGDDEVDGGLGMNRIDSPSLIETGLNAVPFTSNLISLGQGFEPISIQNSNLRFDPIPFSSSGGFMPISFDSLEGFNDFSFLSSEGANPVQLAEREYFDSLPIDSSDSESDSEDVMNLVAFTHTGILNSRYLIERFRVPKSRDFAYCYFRDLPDDDFRVVTRLSKCLFRFILTLIKDDPIFQNRSRFAQAPIQWQLACALDCLGNDGQGVSLARSKMIWGLGHGTVLLYYRRVITALCKLRNTFITWPDGEERAQISGEMVDFGFRGAVGFVDGTTFPLHIKPSLHGHNYFDRKKRYSIHGQVVCDNHHLICHFQTGMPGSSHDSGVFSNSPVVSSPHSFFFAGEYIIADSAYKASRFVVPAYRSGQRDLPDDPLEDLKIERFNTYLAKARVVNEHTIGILKGCWSSLRGLRINLRKRGHIIKVVRHVVGTCVVLHNIAMERDPWELEEDPLLDEHVNEAGNQAQQQQHRRNTVGQQKRFEVRTACLNFHDRS